MFCHPQHLKTWNARSRLWTSFVTKHLKASRGDYYLSELGGFESDFNRKDDDDDLGEGGADGCGGVASLCSNADNELEDGYYEAHAMLEDDARLEAEARDALIPAHARSTQAMLVNNRLNNLLADSDDEQKHDRATCVICQEVFDETSIGEVIFECGHGLHSECFENHRKRSTNNDKCPTCDVTWELSDYGVKPPNAPEKGIKKKTIEKNSKVGGTGKEGGIRLELSALCDALSLPRGTDEAKLLNRIKELTRLSADSAQSVV